MKFEGVGRVSVSDLRFQICWQVDNVDSFERTPVGSLVVSIESSEGRVRSETYFLGQIPHPIQSSSEMKAILAVESTSIQSLPVRGRKGEWTMIWCG